MKICEEITAIDGTIYTVLGHKDPYTLLSHETPQGDHFLVVQHARQDQNGLYKWPIHYRFGADLLPAFELFERETQK
ncbi:hypothetical protein LJC32_03015 [Oscillospiraceae bacterium OttesenSCG-928-F05]|nr:hypothetical protein [Oscillospiraceae bacterium OttesenSCG-928-F05]